MTKGLIVYVTAPSRKEADKIAQTLVEKRLAACVSIVPEIYSRYTWKGHMEYSKELLMMIKTTRARYAALEKCIRGLHSYDVPEIVALPIMKASSSYIRWMKAAVQ